MAKESPKVFRKVSLERLSSPEQLDQLMQVTDPKGWLALGAASLLLVCALVWGVWGRIPTEAPGEGMLLRRGGLSEVVAAGSGQVEELRVAVGDTIERGQVVATIRQEELERRIADAETRRDALREEFAELERFAAEQRRLAAANVERQEANAQRAIETLERELGLLDERLTVQRDLLNDGLVTQQTLLDTERQINTARDQLAAQRLELGGLELRRLEEDQELVQRLEGRRAALRDLELELRELRASLEEDARVVASEGGRVVELALGAGDVVQPGTPILTLELESEELVAVLFVPAALGKQVLPGMAAQVVPSTVRREEYGFLVGEVTRVAEFPSTRRGMVRLLANEGLVERLMEAGPPIQIDVRLLENPSTASGFEWSSAAGPDLEISSGTLASGGVVVREDRPIALVIPAMREWLGV